MQKTITLLEKKLSSLLKAKDGVLEAFKIIKESENTEDAHLKDLYNKFDSEFKSHQKSLAVLTEANNKANAAVSVGK